MLGLKDKSMSSATIDRLIINSPYQEPSRHWRYERETRLFSLEQGRRSSRRGYADFANRAGAEAAA
jgi:type III restriction enzyme